MIQRMHRVGIMFSPEMVRALLAFKKWQTRRMKNLHNINKHPDDFEKVNMTNNLVVFLDNQAGAPIHVKFPYGIVNNILCVKERWSVAQYFNKTKPTDIHFKSTLTRSGVPSRGRLKVDYLADGPPRHRRARRRSPMFLPLDGTRIRRRITNVRCERLQDITQADAVAEGVGSIAEYFVLWDKINPATPAAKNPWVFVYEFEKDKNTMGSRHKGSDYKKVTENRKR